MQTLPPPVLPRASLASGQSTQGLGGYQELSWLCLNRGDRGQVLMATPSCPSGPIQGLGR